MNTIEAFEQWLTNEGFQPATVRNYGRALAALHRYGADDLPIVQVYVAAVRAFLRSPFTTNNAEFTAAATAYADRAAEVLKAPTNRVQARRAVQQRRRREAKSIGEDAFGELAAAAWAQQDPASSVISVLCATGLRIGDVLAVTRRQLSEGAQHGLLRLVVKGGDTRVLPWAGAADEWARLSQAFRTQPQEIQTVAALLTETPDASTLAGDAAYKQVDVRLKRLAKEIGLAERIHLHRLRRTVAVRALTQTDDIAAVQQMLGHRSIQTTARYVDEARPGTLAGIQQSINPRKRTP